MIYLVITILLNVVIVALFKIFPRYRVDTLQAIVANYFICVLTGILFAGHLSMATGGIPASWLPWLLLMGAGFISIFNLIGYCTKVDGITTTTISNKLSLVIPVVFSILLYHEQVGAGKFAGLLLALPAVYLTTRMGSNDKGIRHILWPSLLFVMSGLFDTLIRYIQYHFLPLAAEQARFTTCAFGVAAVMGTGLVIVLVNMKRMILSWKNIVAGICIGVPNYFSIYFLIRTLNSNILQSSAAIPVVNIGIVTVSALTAILFFKEQVTRWRIAGLLLSVVAILLIAFGDK